MDKRRVRLWWIAAGLALLVAGISIALHALLDEENLRRMFIERAEAATGRRVQISALSLQIRPFPALHATGVKLSNPDWASSPHLLEAKSIDARLDLSDLLRGRVEVRRLYADGVTLRPETSRDGVPSWRLKATATSGAAEGSARVGPYQLTRLRIRDLQLVLRDAAGHEDAWRIGKLDADSEPGWKEVRVQAELERHGQQMRAQLRLADATAIGKPEATSPGELDLEWNGARLRLAGRLPLAPGWRGLDARADLDMRSPAAPLAFFGMPMARPDVRFAGLKLGALVRGTPDGLEASDVQATLGSQAASGDARIVLSGARPVIDARLTVERLDWARFTADLGRPPPPPKPPGELFHAHPLPWDMLAGLGQADGKIHLRIRSLLLRSGTEVQNLDTQAVLRGAQIQLQPLSFSVFGGKVSGKLALDPRRHGAKLDFDAGGVLLGAWMDARDRKGIISGGPMSIAGSIAATGLSMKDLAASVAGPVTLRVGSARVQSAKLQQAESLLMGLAPMFSAKGEPQVELVCAAARLPFANGRAVAEPLAGVRSSASQLLASGYVDLRRQEVDLRGRVRAGSGINLGMANIADTVRIAGPLTDVQAGLDPDNAPAAVARAGAAVLTAGMSLIATAVWDATSPATDACQQVIPREQEPEAKRSRSNGKARRKNGK